MNNFQIETAQNIIIKQNVAPVSDRILAFIIDMLIIIGYYIILFLILNSLGYKPSKSLIVVYALLSLPVFLYHLLFEVLMNGQSPGKYFLHIRVTKIDGSKPTFGSYLIRWILRLIDISLASGSVALLSILLNGKGQRLGDLAANTTVISEKKRITIEDTLNVDLSEEYKPTFPQVTLLSDKDVQTIKLLYNNALKKRNYTAINAIKEKIIELTEVKTDLRAVDFVNTIIKDYNYYTQQM
ncbi:RDD family protein [Lutibacter sp.]|uniref:RDD family protein n=1 Tax=Lutibacter sp. TaxID=1925666 RepID=UPI0025BBBE41|nr:RDD family protein [Lutibacter sp.]MCF6181511.1 RDD family protein [Lutibacter sp.]